MDTGMIHGPELAKVSDLPTDAQGLVADLMLASARERERIDEYVRKGVERERDQWKARALEAEARLERAADRLLAVFD